MHFALLDFCTRIIIYHYSTFDSSYIFYHQIYIETHDMSFVNILDSFIPVIIY